MSNKYTKILFLTLGVAALTSCSTAYKMGQTPDDVYYSPGKVRVQAQSNDDDYVAGNSNPQRYTGAQRQQQASNYNSYDDYDAYRNDRFLRMSIGSSYRMSAYNDFGMYNGYTNSLGYNTYSDIFSPWNSYYYWNSAYNPYNTFNYYQPYYGGGYYGGGYYGGGYPGVVIGKKGTSIVSTPVSRPRAFNADAYMYRSQSSNTNGARPNGVYLGGNYNNTNTNSTNNNMRRMPSGNTYYNTTNSNNTRSTNVGNNNNYSAPTRTYEAPTRTYTPSSAPASSSSSSSSGSSAPVSRPSRP